MRSAYQISVETVNRIAPEKYAEVAAQLVSALHNSIGEATALFSITHYNGISTATVEVDVVQKEDASDSEVIARAILMMEAPQRVGFDKNIFTAMVKNAVDVPVKVGKRAMPRDELE